MRKSHVAFITFLMLSFGAVAQTITGVIIDTASKQPLVGAVVVVKGTTNGSATDIDGKFSLVVKTPPPFIITVSLLGYQSQDVNVTSANIDKPITVKLGQANVQVKGVTVIESRITEKQKESALTVESMGITAIKETPAANFYEGLGELKGVDLTSASIGFKIINTRGFNSTSPVRSLQIIDGVDNQSPGLNFSLGNFLGASEIDIQKVDLIVGASSAFYGPNAFNGVISMTTQDPFLHPGLTIELKGGERGLFEGGVRYAQLFKNKKGREVFAFKLNAYYLRANDWPANNLAASTNSNVGVTNPGGYDAVNRYGDEAVAGGNNYSAIANQKNYPGLGIFYRTGYLESDLLDYNTQNLKTSGELVYKVTPDINLSYGLNFGTGTTVYQGEDRYSLKGIQYVQNKLEIGEPDKFFVRFYSTNENAGHSYDAVVLADEISNASKSEGSWYREYSTYWSQVYASKVRGFYKVVGNDTISINSLYKNITPGKAYDTATANSILALYQDSISKWQQLTRQHTDSFGAVGEVPRYVPGTARYDSIFNVFSNKILSDGGALFYDKSALYNLQGEYIIKPGFLDRITIGFSGRLYVPDSHGTIFSDTATTTIKADTVNGKVTYDTSITYNHQIYNYEFGVYLGLEKRFLADKVRINVTARLDKNENFNFLVSPAASVVYNVTKNHVLRLSFSAAIRNPTLSDQYLNYNVGPAILVGNLHGYDSLVTVPSFENYINSYVPNKDTLQYFNVAPIKPEKVKTIEIGYRGTFFNSLYIDGSYYFNFYRDFIGYELGAKLVFDNTPYHNLTYEQVYRVSANAPDLVTTQGFSIAANYFFLKYFSLNTNYTWNVIDLHGSNNPIIPAYNTPKNKFNVGISARAIEFKKGNAALSNWGFSINYKWVQGFEYQGSPQFTGFVNTYGTLDAQISKQVPHIYCTFKLGASNLTNNYHYEVYGGPSVGRLAYFSVVFELDKLNKLTHQKNPDKNPYF